jgi:hypothetical protein
MRRYGRQGSGENAGQHTEMLGEGGRKGNAVFAGFLGLPLRLLLYFT